MGILAVAETWPQNNKQVPYLYGSRQREASTSPLLRRGQARGRGEHWKHQPEPAIEMNPAHPAIRGESELTSTQRPVSDCWGGYLGLAVVLLWCCWDSAVH